MDNLITKMVSDCRKYSEIIKKNNLISDISPEKRFFVSGKAAVFGLKDNIASLTPINEVPDLILPFDIKDLVDIYCGYNVVYFITSTDIYSSCISDVVNSGRITKDLPNISFCSQNKFFFDKVILPNSISLSPSVHIKKIATGTDHTMVLLSNGILMCFGANLYGQLGIGNNKNVVDLPIIVDPVLFNGKKIIDVSCGYYHTIVLSEDRIAYSTGRNNSFQIGAPNNNSNDNDKNINCLRSFTKINVVFSTNDETIVKIITSSHNSCILTDKGILYGTGGNEFTTLGSNIYNTFTPIEPFYSLQNYVKDMWCTTLCSFVKLNNDDVYMSGRDHDGSLFNEPISNISEYTKNKYLSCKNIQNMRGLYSILAIDENYENLYMSGNNACKQIVDKNNHLYVNYKNEKISKIIKMNSHLNINIQGGFRICSLSLTKKNGFTKNMCELYSNLFSSIFGDKNMYSDISFQFN